MTLKGVGEVMVLETRVVSNAETAGNYHLNFEMQLHFQERSV